MSYLDKLFSLNGKIAVVTGAQRGLGNAIAKALHSAGSEVLGVDKTEITDKPFQSYKCNVEKKSNIDKLIKYCSSKYDKIDILVNNAVVGFAHNFLQ